MKTIARNASRKIADLKSSHTACRVYSLHNDFTGPECDATYAWGELGRFDYARLIQNDDGTLTIRVHGNLWYQLSEPKPAENLSTIDTIRELAPVGAEIQFDGKTWRVLAHIKLPAVAAYHNEDGRYAEIRLYHQASKSLRLARVTADDIRSMI